MASPQQPSLATSDLFSLPLTVRRQIYRSVLTVRHPLYVFQDGGSHPDVFAPEKPHHWLALFWTDRHIYAEARVVLYESNRFVFVDTTPSQLTLIRSFIASIGSANARQLSHLTINFPVVQRLSTTGKVVLRDDGQKTLDLLRENCVNLKTLEAQVQSDNADNLIKPKHGDTQLVQEGLREIDTQVKAIRSLKNFIVRIYSGGPSSATVESMQEHGWKVFRGDKDHWE